MTQTKFLGKENPRLRDISPPSNGAGETLSRLLKQQKPSSKMTMDLGPVLRICETTLLSDMKNISLCGGTT